VIFIIAYVALCCYNAHLLRAHASLDIARTLSDGKGHMNCDNKYIDTYHQVCGTHHENISYGENQTESRVNILYLLTFIFNQEGVFVQNMKSVHPLLTISFIQEQ